ncbi:hypothetical protein D3C76_1341780 [compost metagenome]
MVVRSELQQLDPQQRPLLQVEQSSDFIIDLGFERSLIRWPRHHLGLDRQAQVGLHHLLGALRAVDEYRTQHVMTGQQGVEAALQRRQVEGAAQAQRRGHVVGRAVAVQLPEEPLAFLGVGQVERRELVTHRRDRQRRQAHVLAVQLVQERLPLGER